MAYRQLASAFEYPDRAAVTEIRSGASVAALRQLLGTDSEYVPEDFDWNLLADAGSDDDALQEEFTRLFEAGEEGPVCPLQESLHAGNDQALENLIRFYNFFGLSLPEDHQEQPDHLTTQLEFLHYLSYQEAELRADKTAVEGLRRAQRDFISHHVGLWVPVMRAKLMAATSMGYFLGLTRLLEMFLQAEQQRLDALLGEISVA